MTVKPTALNPLIVSGGAPAPVIRSGAAAKVEQVEPDLDFFTGQFEGAARLTSASHVYPSAEGGKAIRPPYVSQAEEKSVQVAEQEPTAESGVYRHFRFHGLSTAEYRRWSAVQDWEALKGKRVIADFNRPDADPEGKFYCLHSIEQLVLGIERLDVGTAQSVKILLKNSPFDSLLGRFRYADMIQIRAGDRVYRTGPIRGWVSKGITWERLGARMDGIVKRVLRRHDKEDISEVTFLQVHPGNGFLLSEGSSRVFYDFLPNFPNAQERMIAVPIRHSGNILFMMSSQPSPVQRQIIKPGSYMDPSVLQVKSDDGGQK